MASRVNWGADALESRADWDGGQSYPSDPKKMFTYNQAVRVI